MDYKKCLIKCSVEKKKQLLWCKWGPECVNARITNGSSGTQSLMYHYERHLQWKCHWCHKCEKFVYNSQVCKIKE